MHKILSSSSLKLIAMAVMLIAHTGYFLWPYMSETTSRVLFYIGRLGFPIFLFLIVEGYRHTRSRSRYALTLLLFALISEPVWDYTNYGVFFSFRKQCVLWTLLMALLVVWLTDRIRTAHASGQRLSLPLVAQYVAVFGICLLAWRGRFDYGLSGVIMALVYYHLRDSKLLQVLLAWSVLGYLYVPGVALTALYNGERGWISGPVAKYAMYIFYPLHLLALWGLSLLLA